jgi:hypothetical protein
MSDEKNNDEILVKGTLFHLKEKYVIWLKMKTKKALYGRKFPRVLALI